MQTWNKPLKHSSDSFPSWRQVYAHQTLSNFGARQTTPNSPTTASQSTQELVKMALLASQIVHCEYRMTPLLAQVPPMECMILRCQGPGESSQHIHFPSSAHFPVLASFSGGFRGLKDILRRSYPLHPSRFPLIESFRPNAILNSLPGSSDCCNLEVMHPRPTSPRRTFTSHIRKVIYEPTQWLSRICCSLLRPDPNSKVPRVPPTATSYSPLLAITTQDSDTCQLLCTHHLCTLSMT